MHSYLLCYNRFNKELILKNISTITDIAIDVLVKSHPDIKQIDPEQNNNKNPLYIDMFGDNRPSGYHYLTVVPIKIFGLNEFATRFPGAIFGGLIFIPFFFLTQFF